MFTVPTTYIRPYFQPTEAQAWILAGFSCARGVVDLGCGHQMAGASLLAVHAARVHAVDQLPKERIQLLEKVTYEQADLSRAWNPPAGFTHALISWPAKDFTGTGPRWEDILPRFERIAYLGRNTATTNCGSKGLWKYLLGRTLESHTEGEKNDLLIYGTPCRPDGPRCQEETNAYHTFISAPKSL